MNECVPSVYVSVCVNKNDYFIFFVQHHIFVSFTLLYVLQRQ